MTLDTAGTQSITATDGATPGIKGSETGITVQAAAASSLVVSGFPTADTAGVAHDVTVTAYDPYGNVATGYTGTVDSHQQRRPGRPPAARYTFTATDAATHTFAVTLDTAGTQSITAKDGATPGLAASETGITVQAAAASSLVVSGFPTTDTAGVAARRHRDRP